MACFQHRCAGRPRRRLGRLAGRALLAGLLALSSVPALASATGGSDVGGAGPSGVVSCQGNSGAVSAGVNGETSARGGGSAWQAATRSPATLAARSPALQAAVSLQTPGAVTLDQVAAMLGPVSKRAITFELSPADEYMKGDLTHRVRLTYSGSLQTLVDQLAQVYGLDVAITDMTIRFSSRHGGHAGGSSPTHTR